MNINILDISFFQILFTSKVWFYFAWFKTRSLKIWFCYIIEKVCVCVPFIKLSQRASFININRDILKNFGLRNYFDKNYFSMQNKESVWNSIIITGVLYNSRSEKSIISWEGIRASFMINSLTLSKRYIKHILSKLW